jgi:hypothetical protein
VRPAAGRPEIPSATRAQAAPAPIDVCVAAVVRRGTAVAPASGRNAGFFELPEVEIARAGRHRRDGRDRRPARRPAPAPPARTCSTSTAA